VRPTIPLSDWRLAIDLDATRSIKRQSGHPADGCACEQCLRWRRASKTAFPKSIAEQLHRIGVEPGQVTDLYVTEESKELVSFRVMYHVAGKILSGPKPWHDTNDELGVMHYYKVVQESPTYVSLRVSTAKQSYQFAPNVPAGSTSDVLCLDFRLNVLRG
jgi:hypothetical protein